MAARCGDYRRGGWVLRSAFAVRPPVCPSNSGSSRPTRSRLAGAQVLGDRRPRPPGRRAVLRSIPEEVRAAAVGVLAWNAAVSISAITAPFLSPAPFLLIVLPLPLVAAGVDPARALLVGSALESAIVRILCNPAAVIVP